MQWTNSSNNHTSIIKIYCNDNDTHKNVSFKIIITTWPSFYFQFTRYYLHHTSNIWNVAVSHLSLLYSALSVNIIRVYWWHIRHTSEMAKVDDLVGYAYRVLLGITFQTDNGVKRIPYPWDMHGKIWQITRLITIHRSGKILMLYNVMNDTFTL